MKYYMFLIFMVVFGKKTYSQYFTIAENKSAKKNFYFNIDTLRSYKIVPTSRYSKTANIGYPLQFDKIKLSSKDTLAMIGELLVYEGDNRFCYLPIRCYNPMSSQIYMGDEKRYTLQVEALFLINQLFFEAPFNYSPYPLLIDKKNHLDVSGKEKMLQSAYSSYKIWYSKIKEIGLREAKVKNIEPLRDTSVQWYR